MKHRTIIALLLLIVGATIAGCGGGIKINRDVTITNYLEAEGFKPSQQHPLLSLEKIRGEQGSSSGSLSGSTDWFFLGGNTSFKGSSSSHLEPGTSLDFALITAKQQVGVLEVPYSKIEFAFNPHVATPIAHFYYDELILYRDNKHEDLWSVSEKLEEANGEGEDGENDASEKNSTINELTRMSISQMIVSHLRNVTITLSKATFSQDILPLIHQLPSVPTKTEG